MPTSATVVPVQPQRDPDPGHRPVADPAFDLGVRAALPRPDRHPDLDEDLGVADAGLVGTLVELPDGDDRRPAPLSIRALDHRLGPQRRQRGGEVLRRVGLAHRPADRAAVADHRVRDEALGVVQDREELADDRRAQQLRVPDHRADAHVIAAVVEPVSSVRSLMSIKVSGSASRSFIIGMRLWPPATSRDSGSVTGEEGDRVGDARGPLVAELDRHLHRRGSSLVERVLVVACRSSCRARGRGAMKASTCCRRFSGDRFRQRSRRRDALFGRLTASSFGLIAESSSDGHDSNLEERRAAADRR